MKTSMIDNLEWLQVDKVTTNVELYQCFGQIEQGQSGFMNGSREMLHRCEAKYLAILESVDAYMTLVDKNLKILWANEKAKKLFGRDIIGKTCCQALYNKKKNCANGTSSCMTRQAFSRNRVVKRRSLEIKSKEGKMMYFEGTAKVVSRDNEGRPSLVVKVYKDITERKLAEEVLHENIKQMRRNLDCTIRAISRTVEMRDAYTAGHQKRTTEIASAIAFEMGLSKQVIDAIRMAGVIHDLGKISVPAEILSKPGTLNDSEVSLIKQHPQTSYEILEGIDFKWSVADIVLQHHERLNGSGYPYNLQGDQILLEARILGVADVIDAMASHRPYRPALGIDEAFEEITTNRGILYDADVVDAAIELFTVRGYQFH
jgi:PAS domain S-box-containing protein/putative nucleotidyltransferase with HDIG domain